MIDDERKQFYTLVGDVYGFYRIDCTEFAYGVWWEACKPFDYRAVADALNRHAMNPDTGQFLPKPADVVKMIGGTMQDGAQIAWTKVDKAVRMVGPYVSPTFDDPIIHKVIADMGGWTELGRKDDEAWPFIAKEFETRYRGYRIRGKVEDVPALAGIIETENGPLGGPVEPRLVGNHDRAQQVQARIEHRESP